MINKTKNIETSIEDENIFTYLELPSRMLLYMNGKPVMAKFHLNEPAYPPIFGIFTARFFTLNTPAWNGQ
jgi:hypothetical protein